MSITTSIGVSMSTSRMVGINTCRVVQAPTADERAAIDGRIDRMEHREVGVDVVGDTLASEWVGGLVSE